MGAHAFRVPAAAEVSMLLQAPKPGEVVHEQFQVIRTIGNTASKVSKTILLASDLSGKDFRPVVVSMPGDLSPESMSRTKRESIALSHLNHPNIIPAIATGIHTTTTGLEIPFHVTPYIPNGDVKGFEVTDSASATEALRIGTDAARATEHLVGKHRVAHRDLKPSNVLYDGTKKAMLADLELVVPLPETTKEAGYGKAGPDEDAALALVLESRLPLAQNPTGANGSEDYAAPERFMFNGLSTPQSEAYALAVTVLELFGHIRVWAAHHPNADFTAQILNRRVDETVLRALKKFAPSASRKILLAGIDPNPDNRPAIPETRATLEQDGFGRPHS